jgi:Protein of unknown function (DUF4245)
MAQNRVAESVAASEGGPEERKRKSLRQTVRDMVLSMGLVALIIFAFMAISWRPQPDPVHPVDSLPVAQAAAAVASYPVLYPQVPAGWRATSARFAATEESNDKPVWFNGWVTPDSQYAAIIQAKTTDEDFVAEQTIDGVPLRDRSELPPSLAGWDAYITQDSGQRSLVRQDEGVTTVVTGTQSWAGLAAFVDMLSPVAPPEQSQGR